MPLRKGFVVKKNYLEMTKILIKLQPSAYGQIFHPGQTLRGLID